MERFDELLFEATDGTMRRVFGERGSDLIYRLMERHALLKRKEIARNIEAFYSHWEKLLGSEGTRIIQATSLRCLCLKLRREYEEVETYFSILDELYEIKFKLLASSLKEERSVCN